VLQLIAYAYAWYELQVPVARVRRPVVDQMEQTLAWLTLADVRALWNPSCEQMAEAVRLVEK